MSFAANNAFASSDEGMMQQVETVLSSGAMTPSPQDYEHLPSSNPVALEDFIVRDRGNRRKKGARNASAVATPASASTTRTSSDRAGVRLPSISPSVEHFDSRPTAPPSPDPSPDTLSPPESQSAADSQPSVHDPTDPHAPEPTGPREQWSQGQQLEPFSLLGDDDEDPYHPPPSILQADRADMGDSHTGLRHPYAIRLSESLRHQHLYSHVSGPSRPAAPEQPEAPTRILLPYLDVEAYKNHLQDAFARAVCMPHNEPIEHGSLQASQFRDGSRVIQEWDAKTYTWKPVGMIRPEFVADFDKVSSTLFTSMESQSDKAATWKLGFRQWMRILIKAAKDAGTFTYVQQHIYSNLVHSPSKPVSEHEKLAANNPNQDWWFERLSRIKEHTSEERRRLAEQRGELLRADGQTRALRSATSGLSGSHLDLARRTGTITGATAAAVPRRTVLYDPVAAESVVSGAAARLVEADHNASFLKQTPAWRADIMTDRDHSRPHQRSAMTDDELRARYPMEPHYNPHGPFFADADSPPSGSVASARASESSAKVFEWLDKSSEYDTDEQKVDDILERPREEIRRHCAIVDSHLASNNIPLDSQVATNSRIMLRVYENMSNAIEFWQSGKRNWWERDEEKVSQASDGGSEASEKPDAAGLGVVGKGKMTGGAPVDAASDAGENGVRLDEQSADE